VKIFMQILLVVVLCTQTNFGQLSQSGIISTYVGPGLPLDGSLATTQSIDMPMGVACDGHGGYYFSCPSNHRIYHVKADGRLQLAAGDGNPGYGGDGGQATSAQLNLPLGIAVDSAGNIYICDTLNSRIRKVTPAGVITTVAGTGGFGYTGDGEKATSATLSVPHSVAVDSSGALYIADDGNNRIRKVDPSGIISTVAGNGTAGHIGDGSPATSAQISGANSVAVDFAGNLYIADYDHPRIRKVNPAGQIITIVGNDTEGFSGDGDRAYFAQIGCPCGLSVDAVGNLYIVDTYNNRIRKVTPSGIISTVAGNGTSGYSGDGGRAISASLNKPNSVAVDSKGNLYIADTYNYRIRKVTSSKKIMTAAGDGTHGYRGDGGFATSALLNSPRGVALDTKGNFYIADADNCRVRQVTPAGTIATVVGNGKCGYGGDGGQATLAELNKLFSVAVDYEDNLYIADTWNNRIRKVSATGIISTVAGGETRGFAGDGGPATKAQLASPLRVAVDAKGSLYICDADNNSIRRVDPEGIITTVVGDRTTGYNGDGFKAIAAKLAIPNGIALDKSGNLYISDTNNSRIRKVDPEGIITTIAGNGTRGISGDGGLAISAQLVRPYNVAIDSVGNLYIADSNYIRKVTAAGVITTIAGNMMGGNEGGFSGDGGPATLALLSGPFDVAVDPKGNLYIADTGNHRIRKVSPSSR
jgi:trimeric autotransporter adhesin